MVNPEKHGEGIRDAYILYEIIADEVPPSAILQSIITLKGATKNSLG